MRPISMAFFTCILFVASNYITTVNAGPYLDDGKSSMFI